LQYVYFHFIEREDPCTSDGHLVYSRYIAEDLVDIMHTITILRNVVPPMHARESCISRWACYRWAACKHI